MTIKVLALLPPPAWGGLHAHLAATARAFAAAGHGQIVPCIPAGTAFDAIEARFATFGLVCERAPMSRIRFNKPWANLNYLARLPGEVAGLARLTHAGGYDVIQTAGAHHFHGLLASWAARCPLVWQFHSDLAPAPARRVAAKLARRFAGAIMVNGLAVARRFPGVEQAVPAPICFAPVIELEAFDVAPGTREAVRESLGLLADEVAVGTVGVRSRQKGHEFLLAAAEQVPNARFVILGKGDSASADYYRSAVLESEAGQRLRAEGRVLFVEPERSIADYLAAFDVFAMSSIAEGMPIAVAEAMQMRLPAVCFDVGGMGEMVDDGLTGFIAAPRDAAAMAGHLRRLVGDAAMRSAFGQAAQEKAGVAYVPAVSAQAHHRAYAQAIAARS